MARDAWWEGSAQKCQIPSTKCQTISKFKQQNPNVKRLLQGFLSFSFWTLFGFWCLDLGILGHLLLSFGWGAADAAEADGIPCQAGIGETGRLTESIRGAQSIGRRFPRAAAEHVLLAVGRPAWVFLRAGLVVALVVGVL